MDSLIIVDYIVHVLFNASFSLLARTTTLFYSSIMDSESLRNKCAACYRQFNKNEHLVEHMKISFHSVHEPMCGVCGKHCRSFESLREHLIPYVQYIFTSVFSARGCSLCLTILNGPNAVDGNRKTCQFSRTNLGSHYDILSRISNMGINGDGRTRGPQAFALGCKMVGGGSDGSLNLCARLCLIDEDNRIILQAYVKPLIPVTNYRFETTGVRPEYLRDSNAMQLRDVQKIIQDFLCNGEPIWKIRSSKGTGKARILVGHGLGHDLESLGLEYPSKLIRDTAKYPPLMKTSKLSNTLKYLAQAYLGYDIQTGIQDPFEDCVATMMLYKRMRNHNHKAEDVSTATDAQNGNSNNFAGLRQNDLERMTPDQLLAISTSDYHCWCLDSKH
ncbi:uncharacterized protein LOC113326392 [Papaver somniferum]|uniref:uncharacterized protein LOC113326392 n=1 Tax=Papaver somniferum TaxID=3469 RepID=UPI000E6FBFB6|nr:uncharacterized protein LOC113326392 [Papaver somniferum]